MASILLILIAWLVKMPLWLSIVITVMCGLDMCLDVFKIVVDVEDQIEIETQVETKPIRKKKSK